jgi:hypothetical protein
MKLAKKESREGVGGSSSNPNFALFCLLSQLPKLGEEEGVGKEGRKERKGKERKGKEGSIRSVCTGAQQMT